MHGSSLSLEEIAEGLVAAIPNVGIVLDHDGTFVDIIANSRTESLLYDDPESLIGKTLDDVFPEPTADTFMMVIERALETGRVQNHEYTLPVKGGTKHFQGHVSPLPTDDGEAPHVIWIAEDITERKERTRELERHERFLETARDRISVIDEDGAIRYDSPTVREHHGYDPDERVGDSAFDYIHPEDRERVSDHFADRLAGQTAATVIDYRVRDKDGTWTWVESVGRVLLDDPAVEGIVVSSRDIDERKERERHLRRIEQAIEASSHAIYITDVDGRIEYANPAFEEITGYPPEEALGRTPRILKSGEMPDGYYEELWTSLLAGEEWEEEVVNRRKDGERYFAQQTITPVWTDSDEIEAFVAIQSDITDRVELEEERQREHDHLVRTERLAAIGGWEYVPETGALRWTAGTRRIHEVDDEYQPTVEKGLDFYHPDDQPIIEEAVANCLDYGTDYSLELRLITAEGRQRWVHTTGERTVEKGTTKVTGVIQDITYRKTNEQRLMVLNRVLRHNLRNKLNAVMGYADVLQTHLPGESEELLGYIERSATELITLAEKSRRFDEAIEFDYTNGPVNVERALAAVCAEIRSDYPEATIETDLEAVSVPANESGLEILFGELIENAIIHADSHTPTVSITASRTSGQRVEISVVDNGPGIPEHEMTVLSSGKETALVHSDGIGLWIVNWLVTKLSGGVDVTTDTPGGTTVTVTLPAVTAE